MKHEEEFVAEDFRDDFGNEVADETEEYLRYYPFPIQEYQEPSGILNLLINKKHKNQASKMSALILSCSFLHYYLIPHKLIFHLRLQNFKLFKIVLNVNLNFNHSREI